MLLCTKKNLKGNKMDIMEPDESQWDFIELNKIFKEPANQLSIYLLDFKISTDEDKKQLEMPKLLPGYCLYTAGFFCKLKNDWFIYRVIYRIEKLIFENEMKTIKLQLEQAARTSIEIHKKYKDPLKYLKNICIYL